MPIFSFTGTDNWRQIHKQTRFTFYTLNMCLKSVEKKKIWDFITRTFLWTPLKYRCLITIKKCSHRRCSIKKLLLKNGHLEISASATRHRHRHWHQHLRRHCESFIFSLRSFFFFFEKIEHLCPIRLNILRCALLLCKFAVFKVRIMAISINIVHIEIAMVRKHYLLLKSHVKKDFT